MAMVTQFELEGAQGVIAANDTWRTGVTKEGRLISKQNLDIDWTITKTQINSTSKKDLSNANPGIVRIYQEGFESSAVSIEEKGVGPYTQVVNLDITGANEANRIMVIDAWDPDVGSPNNTCSFGGEIIISGKPKVSSFGAS